MEYKFVCPKCNQDEIVNMRISEYTADGHVCKNCGAKLKRSVDSFCRSYSVKCDGFFGKSKQRE